MDPQKLLHCRRRNLVYFTFFRFTARESAEQSFSISIILFSDVVNHQRTHAPAYESGPKSADVIGKKLSLALSVGDGGEEAKEEAKKENAARGVKRRMESLLDRQKNRWNGELNEPHILSLGVNQARSEEEIMFPLFLLLLRPRTLASRPFALSEVIATFGKLFRL
jgi:hypothetical protein